MIDPLTLASGLPTLLNTASSLRTLFQKPYNPPTVYQENSREVFKQGGKIRGHNKYDAPAHNQGGQTVNIKGNPVPNTNQEIEKKEGKYTYSNIKNSTYVFTPEDEKKVNKLTKKYSNANKSQLEKNALELEIQRVENNNEMKKSNTKKYKKGGRVKYNDGGPIVGLGAGFQDVLNALNAVNNIGKAPMDYMSNRGTPNTEVPATRPENKSLTTSTPMNNPVTESTNDPLKTLDTLRNITLGASSLGFLRGAEKENPILTDYSKARSNLSNLSADLSNLREQTAQSSNQLRNINRNSASSFNTFANREAQRVSNLGQTLSNISLRERNLQNNISSQKANFEARAAQDNAQTLRQNRINNQQNKANSEFIKSQIATDVMSELDRKSRIINKANIQEGNTIENMAYMSSMFENFQPGDLSLVLKVKKSGIDSLNAAEKERLNNLQPVKFKNNV